MLAPTSLGLTSIGMFHTLLSLVAVAAGIASLGRFGAIASSTRLGRLYLWMTVFTCVTGFGVFQHGGFGKPHTLGIVTLVVLAIAFAAERRNAFGRLSAYIAMLGYSLSFFFHVIPGFTETSTRLPAGHPLASGADDPNLQAAIGVAFLVFLAAAAWQLIRLRASRRGIEAAVAPA
jgi:uncharacterized membrane protein